jgi:hypothetical protein
MHSAALTVTRSHVILTVSAKAIARGFSVTGQRCTYNRIPLYPKPLAFQVTALRCLGRHVDHLKCEVLCIMGNNRITAYWTKWKELTLRYGDMCFYCGEEAATSIDHVLPYSYAVVNSIENLRPACAMCNCIAGDKMFDSDTEKKWYILSKRNRRHDKNMRYCTCTECRAPYIYRMHSPSLFMCPECYDEEYGTHYATSKTWDSWLALLADAQMWIDIFRIYKGLRRRAGRLVSPANLLKESRRLMEARQLQGVRFDESPTAQCLLDASYGH